MKNHKLPKGTFENISYQDVRQILQNNISPIHHKANDIRVLAERILQYEKTEKISQEGVECLREYKPYVPEEFFEQELLEYSNERISIPEELFPFIQDNPEGRKKINQFILKNPSGFSKKSENPFQPVKYTTLIPYIVPLCQNIDEVIDVLEKIHIFQSKGGDDFFKFTIQQFHIKTAHDLLDLLCQESWQKLNYCSCFEDLQSIFSTLKIDTIQKLNDFHGSELYFVAIWKPDMLHIAGALAKNHDELVNFVKKKENQEYFPPIRSEGMLYLLKIVKNLDELEKLFQSRYYVYIQTYLTELATDHLEAIFTRMPLDISFNEKGDIQLDENHIFFQNPSLPYRIARIDAQIFQPLLKIYNIGKIDELVNFSVNAPKNLLQYEGEIANSSLLEMFAKMSEKGEISNEKIQKFLHHQYFLHEKNLTEFFV